MSVVCLKCHRTRMPALTDAACLMGGYCDWAPLLPAANPVETLRAAVRVIWNEVDALSAPPDVRRMIQAVRMRNRYTEGRTRLFAAAVNHSTGLGLNFAEVGALFVAYDTGLGILKEITPE